jgi:hypothetical protein
MIGRHDSLKLFFVVEVGAAAVVNAADDKQIMLFGLLLFHDVSCHMEFVLTTKRLY